MLKYIITAATVALLSGAAIAADIPEGCNAATQNWQNGSGYTCPVSDSGGDKFDAHQRDAAK